MFNPTSTAHLGHLTLGFMTPAKSSSDKNPPQIGHPAKPATKQLKFPKKKKGKYCFQYKSVRGKAGPTGLGDLRPLLYRSFSQN
jgi:hypothetical protein